MTIADLVIKLGLDDQASKQLNTLGGKVKGGFQRALLPAAGALAVVAAGAKKTIDAASAVNEAQSAVNVTFGKSAGIINDYASSTEDAFSKVQFLSASKGFAVFGKSAGLAGEDLANFSSRLVFAAQDMASFHDADPSQVLDDIKSGLAGETEPLRKYGILLNDAALRQEAMRQGLVKNTKQALSPQNKVLAAQALILKKMGPAQGDFARTANSAANQERIQAANAEDLNAKLGKGLLPVYQSLQRVLLTVTSFLGSHTGAVKIAAAAIAILAGFVLVVNAGFKLYAAGTKAVAAATKIAAAAQWLFNQAMKANGIVLVVTLLAALVVALVVAYKKSATFRRIVHAAFDAVRGVVQGFVGFFTKTLPAAFSRVLGWVRSNWPKIAVLLSGPFAPIVALATDAFGIRSKLLGALGKLLGGARDKAKAIGLGIWHGIVDGVSGIAGALAGIVRGAINAVITAIRGFGIPGFKIDPPGPGSFTFGGVHPFSGIPYLAKGGIATDPTLAMIGEGSSPEAVLPLNARTLAGLGLGGGKTENHFHFTRYSGNRRELIADVVAGLDEHKRLTGRDAI